MVNTACSTKPTVFIVDDDAETRHALQWFLESESLSVEVFDSGQDFLNNYRSTRLGCVIIDVQMPIMDGITLMERLKSENIFFTCHHSHRIRQYPDSC